MNIGSHQQCKAGQVRRQSGAYAIEFALILPVAFVLSYAVIAFGLMFFLKQNLQYAAEQGARAALVYQPATADRLLAATTAVSTYLAGTLNGASPPTATICKVGDACEPGSPPAACGNSATEACLVHVVAEYDVLQEENPLFVRLPGLGSVLPTSFILKGSATALISGGAL